MICQEEISLQCLAGRVESLSWGGGVGLGLNKHNRYGHVSRDQPQPAQRPTAVLTQSYEVFSHVSPGEKVSTVQMQLPTHKDNRALGEPIVKPSGRKWEDGTSPRFLFTMCCYKQGRLIDPCMWFWSQTPTDVTSDWNGNSCWNTFLTRWH